MKLYIGNLPYDITEVDLREALTNYEPIEDIHIPLDRETGSARGFAFVRLGSAEMGEKYRKEKARPDKSNDGPRKRYGSI